MRKVAELEHQALPLLNDWVIGRAEHYGFLFRWHGLRLVAADASTVRFGLRASHVKRAALPDQILFGLFLHRLRVDARHLAAQHSRKRAADVVRTS